MSLSTELCRLERTFHASQSRTHLRGWVYDTRNLSKYVQKAPALSNAHGQAHKAGRLGRENETQKISTEKICFFFLVLTTQIHHGSTAQTSPRCIWTSQKNYPVLWLRNVDKIYSSCKLVECTRLQPSLLALTQQVFCWWLAFLQRQVVTAH